MAYLKGHWTIELFSQQDLLYISISIMQEKERSQENLIDGIHLRGQFFISNFLTLKHSHLISCQHPLILQGIITVDLLHDPILVFVKPIIQPLLLVIVGFLN